jgi:hypothetical protein
MGIWNRNKILYPETFYFRNLQILQQSSGDAPTAPKESVGYLKLSKYP